MDGGRSIARWRIEREWEGETVAILAGGPSLTQAQVDACRGKCRVLAINNSYRLAPWADALYFCDRRWYDWHCRELEGFTAPIYTLENYDLAPLGIRCVHNMGRDGLYLEPDGVMTGRNSGVQAINVAVHLGVSRMLLLGYDLRVVDGRAHWHNDHKVGTPATTITNWIPLFRPVADALRNLGIQCVNCTPGSALDCFSRGDLADSL